MFLPLSETNAFYFITSGVFFEPVLVGRELFN